MFMPNTQNSVEFDSCAVGLVSNPAGRNISLVLSLLAKLPHRGGQIFAHHAGEVVKVGDGAGVNCSIDRKYFDGLVDAPEEYRNYGIGNFFLPTDIEAREEARQKIESIFAKHGVKILPNKEKGNWRNIEFNSPDSDSAKSLKLQKFEQVFLAPNGEISPSEFENILREIHKEVEAYSHELNQEYVKAGSNPPKLAVASLSCEKVVYKGMLLPHEVAYFTDLQKSNPTEVVYHIRQSTNVSPSPGNSQPFNIIAHNGELNSVKGRDRKGHLEPRSFSDSRTFDEHLRELTLESKSIIEAITTLMPPPPTGNAEIDAMLQDMKIKGLEYNGPAHMVFSIGNVRGAKLDSSALRPSRYLIAKNADDQNCLYVGSEDMFSAENLQEMGLTVVERGMLKAGEMIVIEGNVIKKNNEILSDLASRYQMSERAIEPISGAVAEIPEASQRLDLGTRESEVEKYQLLPLYEGATKKIAMGDDTNPMKTDAADLPTLAEHFKQKFSQVSSPPLDSDKESSSFSLTSYLGNRENGSRSTLLKVDSPILKNGELKIILAKAGESSEKIDLSVNLSAIPDADRNNAQKILSTFRKRITQICEEVEAQVRAGKSIIVLDGSNTSSERMGLPDILVTAAVNSHLHKKNLEKKASLIVNSTQMESAHHFSVLSALGAAAVNPAGAYDFAAKLAEETETDPTRHQATYQEYCDNFCHAIEKAHLVTMGKYGISSADVYAGSRLIETITLNLEETSAEGEYDPSCLSEAFKSVESCGGFNGKFGANAVLTDALKYHQRRYGEQIITSGHFAYAPSGVNHTYNPVVIGAIRNITSSYHTKRILSEQFSQQAKNLEGKAEEISSDGAFNLDSYADELRGLNAKRAIDQQSQDQRITQLLNANERLINSLFFISGIAEELKNTVLRQEELREETGDTSVVLEYGDGFSINEIQIRSFLSIVRSEEAASLAPLVRIFKEFQRGKTTFEDLKAALATKAGYDASEIEKIEKWADLIKSEKASEAAEAFKELSAKNQSRINAVYAEYNRNQQEISALKSSLATSEISKTVTNTLIDLAMQIPATEADQKAKYLASITKKSAELKELARKNNLLPYSIDPITGAFSTAEIDDHKIDRDFKAGMKKIEEDKEYSPVTIADHLSVTYTPKVLTSSQDLDLLATTEGVESVSQIVQHLVTGGMSHGALTSPAHNDVAKAAQLIGSKSCTGEGGKPKGQIAKMIQIASGRFGINPEYFADAEVVEIKVVQGAKPGEGGMLPAGKVSIEIAAARGSNPGFGLISPPPHHDIYSIEDLQELIHDLKEFKPGIKVGVKLCASEGVDQIAIGVAKSGADIINIASGSGGTGAAAIDSIKSTGLPAEIGLVMVHQALSKAGIRPLVELQTSGFPNTPDGVIMMAILGGDILESGTTDIMLLGCDMHRKCNIPGACGPGITNNEAGYQGRAEDLALYKLNLAKAVQVKLEELGVKSLKDLRGRIDLLNPEKLLGKVSDEFIASLLAPSSHYSQLPPEILREYRSNANSCSNQEQYERLGRLDLTRQTIIDAGKVDVTNRTFGATLAFQHYKTLVDKAPDHLTITTYGTAGQSYGAFNANGLCLEHTGSVQDGFGKSMSGGVLVVKQPQSELALTDSIYAGNATLYGASGGKAFIPSAGSRCAVLMKGATLVVNGDVGDYGCEYMTSGSFVALGKVGKHFGSGMSGGIAILYDKDGTLNKAPSDDVRFAGEEEGKEKYFAALKDLLEEDFSRTQNSQVRSILDNFENEKKKFKIIVPKTLDKIRDLETLEKVEKSFAARYQGPHAISAFEKVWLETKKVELSQAAQITRAETEHLDHDLIALQSQLSVIALEQKAKMDQYGMTSRRIVGGLGVPDEILPEDPKEILSQIFAASSKCTCDSVTCSGEKHDRKSAKHPDSGCPLGKNPNLINGALNERVGGRFVGTQEQRAKKAFKLQIESSPFAGFTGSACPAPCQDSCTHSAADEGNAESVKIKRIELLLHKLAIKKGWYDELNVFRPQAEREYADKKVMIVGSGPSALEAAYHLAKRGIQVDIFEKADKAGGLLRYGIPDHKLQKETIDFYIEKLQEMGVKFHTKSQIDISRIKESHPGYDKYLDARGIAQTPALFHEEFNRTNVGEGGNHSFAMDFLSYCNKFVAQREGSSLGVVYPEVEQHPFVQFKLNKGTKTVVVLGSGDTAEDVKRSIMKLNSELQPQERVNIVTINRQPELYERAKVGSSYPYTRESRSELLHSEKSSANLGESSYTFTHYDETSPSTFITDQSGAIIGVNCNATYYVADNVSRSHRDDPQSIAPRSIGSFTIGCDSAIVALGFRAPELHIETAKTADERTAAGAIIAIGDVSTKANLEKGAQLIVSAEASARNLVQELYPRASERDGSRFASAGPSIRPTEAYKLASLRTLRTGLSAGGGVASGAAPSMSW
jgi:glutamate synthase domain-containing protein 2/glutamate synthase domain-containing protein 3/NADPH-dependent glutamate synthase beta subunit-like oxidoreductase/glutamate synthase domain-containing protein 1